MPTFGELKEVVCAKSNYYSLLHVIFTELVALIKTPFLKVPLYFFAILTKKVHLALSGGKLSKFLLPSVLKFRSQCGLNFFSLKLALNYRNVTPSTPPLKNCHT